MIKEFAAKIGFTKLIEKKFKTNDKSVRFHKDYENLLQMIYQVISACFQDDCADELTLDLDSTLFGTYGRQAHGNIQDVWFSKLRNHTDS